MAPNLSQELKRAEEGELKPSKSSTGVSSSQIRRCHRCFVGILSCLCDRGLSCSPMVGE